MYKFAPHNSDERAIANGWHAGEMILNQYQVMNRLSDEGEAALYRVQRQGDGIDLVVKCPRTSSSSPLPQDATISTSVCQALRREAAVWLTLPPHPNVVNCHYTRVHDGLPFLFSEYLAADNLATWIDSRLLYAGGGLRALEKILDVAIQFAWGLHALHKQGLLHLDVRPGNVLLTDDHIVKVTGLGKARPEGEASGESADSYLGQVAYCSPEQAAGQPLTHYTDLWSWGVSLLEMFVGGVVWPNGTLARDALARHDALDTTIPPMPSSVVMLLARCLRERPEERPESMLEIATTLREIYIQQIGQLYPREEPQSRLMLAGALNNRALSLSELGNSAQALQFWEQALALEPYHLEASYNRGLLLWRKSSITDERLLEDLVKAANVQIEHGVPQWRASLPLIYIHLERGDVVEAQRMVTEAATQAPREQEIQALQERVFAHPLTHCLRVFQPHKRLQEIQLSPDGSQIASSTGKQTRLWDAQNGRVLRTFSERTQQNLSLSLSNKGYLAVAGAYAHTPRTFVEVRGTTVKRDPYTFSGDHIPLIHLCANGNCLATVNRTGAIGTINIWNTLTGSLQHSYQTNHASGKGLYAVTLSIDGRWLAVGGEHGCDLWENMSGRHLHTFEDKSFGPVHALSLSADGRYLVAAGGEALQLWDVEKGHSLRIFRGHSEIVTTASLSADGRWLVSSSLGGTIRIWETETGRCLHTLRQTEASGTRIVLSADGARALSRDREDRMRLWRIEYRHVRPVSPTLFSQLA